MTTRGGEGNLPCMTDPSPPDLHLFSPDAPVRADAEASARTEEGAPPLQRLPVLDAQLGHLKAIEEDVAARQLRLTNGSLGAAVQFAPGTFEMVKVITYLEIMLAGQDIIVEAKTVAAERAKAILDDAEKSLRQAILMKGASGPPSANGPSASPWDSPSRKSKQ